MLDMQSRFYDILIIKDYVLYSSTVYWVNIEYVKYVSDDKYERHMSGIWMYKN